MKMALKQKLIVAIAAFPLFLSTAGFAEKVVVIPLPYSSSGGDFAIYDANDTFIGYRLDGDNFDSLKVVNSKKFITQFSYYEYDPYTLDSNKAYLGVNDNNIDVYYASNDCSGDQYITASIDLRGEPIGYRFTYGLAGNPSFGRILYRRNNVAYYLAQNSPLVEISPAYRYNQSHTCVSNVLVNGFKVSPNDPSVTGYQDNYQMPFKLNTK